MSRNSPPTRLSWRTSSYSSSAGGNCVEVASGLPAAVAVRDSKHPTAGTHLVRSGTWRAFLGGIKRGEVGGTRV